MRGALLHLEGGVGLGRLAEPGLESLGRELQALEGLELTELEHLALGGAQGEGGLGGGAQGETLLCSRDRPDSPRG